MFQALAPAMGLRVGLAAARLGLAAEAAQLLGASGGGGVGPGASQAQQQEFQPMPAAVAAGLGLDPGTTLGCSCDVLVATPGRLMAHLEGSPGFTLQHLRFLVGSRVLVY